ncbi:protein of unknown function [Zunongwangia mangrovi]|uniref:DUF932 domain-containing protein n=1 Tax=Zunongwangia mangrovi TaxID=1334022 RepID=A0A1I1MFD5_9FLAO|nr:DUF932 domain-containing protein [Zunongwangia mangrovi]SFC84191.1 protein of unknown function [Zunongwangia mangrovi]
MYLSNLQQDNLYVPNEILSLDLLTGYPSRKGLENAILCNGKIVNVVSKSYGHLSNKIFFEKAERMLQEAGLSFLKRSINRNDRSFVLDLIIKNKNQFEVKNENDQILPMLRFTNSYDGSEKTNGHFGFYRKVCGNGLHVADTSIAFSVRHTRNNTELVMPKMSDLFDKFIENEYYSVVSKFRKLQSIQLLDTKQFVKDVVEHMNLFRYECSDKNPEPSKKSKEVLNILSQESKLLNEEPNFWLGYNALNHVLHTRLKKSFQQQKRLDQKLFDTVLEMV